MVHKPRRKVALSFALSADFEVGFQELVEDAHVLLLGEEDVVGRALQDLAHERQTALHPHRRLPVDDARVKRRH